MPNSFSYTTPRRMKKGAVQNLPYRSNVIAWWKYRMGYTNIGGKLTSWRDDSGNNNPMLQANTALGPSIQSDGGLAFGAAAWMQANFTLAQPCTVYITFLQGSYTANRVVLDGAGNATTLTQAANTPQITANAGVALTADSTIAVGKMGVACFMMNGNVSVYQAGGGSATVTTTGNAGANAPGGITLGANRGGLSCSNVTIREVVVYNTTHDQNQRLQVLRYMARVGNVGGV